MTNTEKVSDSAKKLRTEMVASLDLMNDLARSRYESQKAKEQCDKMIAVWNAFLKEWKELKVEVQIEVKPEQPEKSKGFSKLGRIARKS